MELLTIKELLETGVHFGHRVRKWNPKMKDYIFTQRKGIHIIDLEKTIRLFEEAYMAVRQQVAQGRQVMFVGTKRQVQDTIAQEATRCGALYVNRRWLGGTLTNFPMIKERIERMKKLEEMAESGAFDLLPNKEVVRLKRELAKLQRNLSGLREMTELPGLLYVIDTQVEQNAVREARTCGIPVVALVDTNCDPDVIDYPIPGNDDAIKATKLITARIADAVLEGREGESAAPAPEPAETLTVPGPQAQAPTDGHEGGAEPEPELEPELELEPPEPAEPAEPPASEAEAEPTPNPKAEEG